MSTRQRQNLLRIIKIHDDIAWVDERLNVNTNEYNLTQSENARRRINECVKMRNDFDRLAKAVIDDMSADDDNLSIKSKL